MKNSRTSTNKNNKKTGNLNVIRKSSTSPSSTTSKKINKNVKKSKTNLNSKKRVENKKNNIKSKKIENNRRIQNNNIRPKVVENNYRKLELLDYDLYENNNYSEYENIQEKKIQDKSKPTRKIQDKKVEKKSKIKSTTILKITFFIAFIIVMVYLAFTLETFNLSNINVEGNEKYTNDNIIKSSNFKIGENVFKQLFKSGNKKIDLSYISEHKYKYIFPSTIVIEVKERYPLYIAKDKNTGKYYKIDNEGYILEECDLSSKDKEVVIEGFVFEENLKFGQKVNEVYLEKLDIYDNIKKQLENNNIDGTITKVNFFNSLTTVTLNDKLNIVFANNSDFEYKVSFLKGIIEQNKEITEGTIDMSMDNPVYSKYD